MIAIGDFVVFLWLKRGEMSSRLMKVKGKVSFGPLLKVEHPHVKCILFQVLFYYFGYQFALYEAYCCT